MSTCMIFPRSASQGTPAEIRRRYASGHSLRVALARPTLQEVQLQGSAEPQRLEAGEMELPEDSPEMQRELARRSGKIVEELRPLFPSGNLVEELVTERI